MTIIAATAASQGKLRRCALRNLGCASAEEVGTASKRATSIRPTVSAMGWAAMAADQRAGKAASHTAEVTRSQSKYMNQANRLAARKKREGRPVRTFRSNRIGRATRSART